MAFEIGQRVTSPFTGDGTIKGELIVETSDGKREYRQLVQFDHPLFGEREWQITKLQPLEEAPKGKRHVKKP